MGTVRIFILLACVILLNSTQSGKIKDCPEGWTQVYSMCYKFVERKRSRYYANKGCREQRSSLAVISNEEENKAVHDLISGHGDAWMGLQYRQGSYYWNNIRDEQPDFLKVKPRYYTADSCTVVLADTGNWRFLYCSGRRPYVCGKRSGCESGWAGDKCDRQCHCYLGHVCNDTYRRCPYGCEPGWTGAKCENYREKPTVESVYCMKQRGGYSMMVSMDWKGISFSNVGALNAEGEITPNCSKDRFEKYDGLMYLNTSIQVQNKSGSMEADCPMETLGDGILQWTFRFQLTEGRVSFEDEELRVQCDLSEADAAYEESEDVDMQEIRGMSLFDVPWTSVNIQIYVANPETLKPATNLSLGEPVRLVAMFPEDYDNTPPYIPGNCHASSPDGKVALSLNTSEGCPLSWRFGENEHLILTEMFRMFRLPGHATATMDNYIHLC